MSCDHQTVSSWLDSYLEGRLSAEQKRRYDDALANCAECREVHRQGEVLFQLAAGWQDQDVPVWHRTAYAARPVHRQTAWLNWTAIGASCLSLLLVIFQFELSTEDGLTLSFGGRQAEQRVEQQLAQFQTATVDLLRDELSDFSEDQSAANQLLLAEWMDRSRQERRQDMEFLMTTWEAQRFQDRRQTDEHLSSLARNQIESDQFMNEFLQSVGYFERGSL